MTRARRALAELPRGDQCFWAQLGSPSTPSCLNRTLRYLVPLNEAWVGLPRSVAALETAVRAQWPSQAHTEDPQLPHAMFPPPQNRKQTLQLHTQQHGLLKVGLTPLHTLSCLRKSLRVSNRCNFFAGAAGGFCIPRAQQ